MDGLAISLGAVALSAGGLVGTELSASRKRGPLHTVELRFGRDVAAEAVVALLEQVGARRATQPIVFDTVGDAVGIRHYVTAERVVLDQLRVALRASLPTTRLVPRAPLTERWTITHRLVLRGRLGTLRDDASEQAAAALLSAFQPLAANERVLLRWSIRPGRAQQVPRVENGVAVEPEDRRRLRIKNAGGVVLARGMVAVEAKTAARSRQLLSRLTTALRSRSTAYGFIVSVPPLPGGVDRLAAVPSAWFRGDRYAAAELAGVLGFPVGGPQLPGVTLGTSPILPPSPRLPATGRLLGRATWPEDDRPIAQPEVGALSHSLIAGPTGVGKSTLLLNLMNSDVRAGRGLVLIDGKGDTARGLLACIPKRRRDDVIVLDCASDGPLPGLKLFAGTDPTLAADVVLGVISDLFRDSWGPLSERYLRAGLLAVAQDPEGSLADVPMVFVDAAYRGRLVGTLRDPIARSTLAGLEGMSAAERQHQLAAPLGKLGQLLGRPVVRTVLGQAAPQLDFNAALRNQRIIVISLAPSRVGAAAARLIGALSVFALFQAVQARSDLAPEGRAPFQVYIDEPKSLGDLPMPLDALLEQARGLGVGLTLAPQSVAQLPPHVRKALLTNVGTRVAFRQAAEDAGLLARDLRGVSAEDLQDLDAFEAIAAIALGPGDVAPPVSISTAPAPKTVGDPFVLRRHAEERFGVELQVVDDALDAKHQAPVESAAIGRKRRSS